MLRQVVENIMRGMVHVRAAEEQIKPMVLVLLDILRVLDVLRMSGALGVHMLVDCNPNSCRRWALTMHLQTERAQWYVVPQLVMAVHRWWHWTSGLVLRHAGGSHPQRGTWDVLTATLQEPAEHWVTRVQPSQSGTLIFDDHPAVQPGRR